MSLYQSTIIIINFLDNMHSYFICTDNLDHALETTDDTWAINLIAPTTIRQYFPMLKAFLVLFSRCHYPLFC
jgi:hypothetical protein